MLAENVFLGFLQPKANLPNKLPASENLPTYNKFTHLLQTEINRVSNNRLSNTYHEGNEKISNQSDVNIKYDAVITNQEADKLEIQQFPGLNSVDFNAQEKLPSKDIVLDLNKLQLLARELKETDEDMLKNIVSLIAELLAGNSGMKIDVGNDEKIKELLLEMLEKISSGDSVNGIVLLIPINSEYYLSMECKDVEKLLANITEKNGNVDISLFNADSLKVVKYQVGSEIKGILMVELNSGTEEILVDTNEAQEKENVLSNLMSSTNTANVEISTQIPENSENKSAISSNTISTLLTDSPEKVEEPQLQTQADLQIEDLIKEHAVTQSMDASTKNQLIEIPLSLNLKSIQSGNSPPMISFNGNAEMLQKLEEFLKEMVSILQAIGVEELEEKEKILKLVQDKGIENVLTDGLKNRNDFTFVGKIDYPVTDTGNLNNYFLTKISKLLDEIFSKYFENKENEQTDAVNSILKDNVMESEGTKRREINSYFDVVSGFRINNDKGDILNIFSKAQETAGSAFKAANPNFAEGIMKQILEGISKRYNPTQGEVRIHLKPENLGDLHLRVKMDGDSIVAKIIAHSYEVKAVLEDNFSQLRNALEQHGMKLDKFTVFVNQETNNGNNYERGGTTKSLEIRGGVISENVENLVLPYEEWDNAGYPVEEYAYRVNYLA